ncbi:hypothetical protein XCR_0606 [Xanthomonas campestris pv. raphani 756C]|nr:hypothetical protein XCR_0606 [Xanthomonas campestris pv. raphani 756C]
MEVMGNKGGRGRPCYFASADRIRGLRLHPDQLHVRVHHEA